MNELFDKLISKSSLKQTIYKNTLECFQNFKEQTSLLIDTYNKYSSQMSHMIPIEFTERGSFAFELTFGGDVLIFMMHTNVFLFPRHDVINNTSYVKEDPERAYCGMIHIYNFLADSFKYKRMDDVGYLIGRIFVNKEKHYFLQGKQEIGRHYNNFHTSILDQDAIKNIIELAILYTIGFDLLIPSFDEVKEVSAYTFQEALENMRRLPTGKRLGFRFNADQVSEWLNDE
ncbi:MAG: hypothetical protein PHR53_03560 [Bacteroidales bacterium]|nr:hypothetical protein [Bacteroidales bacterium]